MRLQLLSDLHFEHQSDSGFDFISKLDPTGVDVLIMAGDIAPPSHLAVQMAQICDKYPMVLMVYGNHHFYGYNRKTVVDFTRSLEKKLSNFRLLDNEIFEIDGHRFVGTPLWFSRALPRMEKEWSDFHWIDSFRDWVYDENTKAQQFLEDNLKEGDIVITHYLPSEKSVDPKWKGDPTNCFFVCDVEPLIEKRKPSYWFHGHTHRALDYKIGDTRVVCNPYGYVKYNEHTGYHDNLNIDI